MGVGIIESSSYSVLYQQHTEVSSGTRTGEHLENKATDRISIMAEISRYKLEVLLHSEENFNSQSDLFTLVNPSDFETTDPRDHLKIISGLSQQEAQNLISEDGFYGVSRTAARIAEFVIMGAGDDIEKLRAGREGITRGLKEAEQMWGGALPDISYETLSKALEQIDEHIRNLGKSVLDIAA